MTAKQSGASPRAGDPAYAGLHVLADDDPRWKWNPVEQARAACLGGAAVVQLRAKNAGDREVLAWAREIRALTSAHSVRFVVNDRFDLAIAAGADGVHLGQTDLPPAAIPEPVRAHLSVGRSSHTLEQAQAALSEPIDYLAFGPVYGTTSKESDYTRRGPERLGEIARLVAPRALVAIGGITLDRIREVVEGGARGVAVISAVAGSDDPEAAVRALCAEISAAVEATRA